MYDERVALVTGANKGIGLQIARDLAAHGIVVIVGSRDLERGEKAAKDIAGNARAVRLDVTDRASISAAAGSIRAGFGRLDILVNNAAISHAGEPGRTPPEVGAETRPSVVDLDEMRAIYETNVFGVVAVTQAMLPLLREAPTGRIVNVSSGAGSLSLNADPDKEGRELYASAYAQSKTALNGVTLAFAIELEPEGIKVNSACPGFTATDLNNFAGTQTVEEAAREPMRLALLEEDGPTGTFSDSDRRLPW